MNAFEANWSPSQPWLKAPRGDHRRPCLLAIVPVLAQLCFSSLAATRSPNLEWLILDDKRPGVWGSDVAVDKNGDAYLVALFMGQTNESRLTRGVFGTNQLVLAKSNWKGEQIWAISRPAEPNLLERDYVVVGTDSAVVWLSHGLSNRMSLTKLNPNGWQVWRRVYGQTNGWIIASSLAAAPGGGFYVSGRFTNQLQLGSLTLTPVPVTPAPPGGPWPTRFTPVSFIAKFGADGKPLWARDLTSSHRVTLHQISSDPAGNCFVTGFASFFRGGIPPTDLECVFVAKYDGNGNLLWVRTSDDHEDMEGHSRGHALGVDAAGHCYVWGNYAGRTFSLNGKVPPPPDSPSHWPQFLVHYDADGGFVWAKTMPNRCWIRGCHPASTPTGTKIFLTGLFDQLSSEMDGFFLAEYDSKGVRSWATDPPKRDSGNSNRLQVAATTLAPGGELFLTGRLCDSAHLDCAQVCLAKVLPSSAPIEIAVVQRPEPPPRPGVGMKPAEMVMSALPAFAPSHAGLTQPLGPQGVAGILAIKPGGANLRPEQAFAPDLQISHSEGKIFVSWPSSAKGWQLEGSDALAPVIKWEAITNAPVLVNERFVVAHEPIQGRWFYRLRQP
jgi:hypothetical protein